MVMLLAAAACSGPSPGEEVGAPDASDAAPIDDNGSDSTASSHADAQPASDAASPSADGSAPSVDGSAPSDAGGGGAPSDATPSDDGTSTDSATTDSGEALNDAGTPESGMNPNEAGAPGAEAGEPNGPGDAGANVGAPSDAAAPDGSGGNDAAVGDAAVNDSSLCSCGPGEFLCNGLCWSSPTCTPTFDPAFDCPTAAHTQFVCGATCASCTVASCDPGWADCDGVASDGCEADLSSTSNCGACGTTCSGTNYLCGTAGCEAVCSAGESFCSTNRCVNLQTSAEDCGSCTNACPAPSSGGSSMCVNGACSPLSCPAGTTECNGSCVPASTVTCGSTCGINTTRDVNNCGACGNVCTVPAYGVSGGASCVDSQCIFEGCQPPLSTVCNGACVATSVDVNNCGSCGNSCANGEICAQPGVCVATSSLVLATGLVTPGLIVTDADNVYWLDAGTYTVNAVAKSGGTVQVLAQNQYDLTEGMHIALDDTYVYWTAHGILRTRKDGTGAVETVAMPTDQPQWINVIGGNVYFASGLGAFDVVPVTGGTPSTSAFSQYDGTVLEICDGKSIYVFVRETGPSIIDAITPPSTTVTRAGGLNGSTATGTWTVLAGPGGVLYAGSWNNAAPAPDYYQVDFQASEANLITLGSPSYGTPLPPVPIWAPTSCGIAFDAPASGLQFLETSTSSPDVPILSDSAVTSLGGFTEMFYDPDGYVYFVDGNNELGRVSIR